MLTLITGDGELFVARLSGTIAAGNGGCTVGSTATYLRNIKEFLRAVANRHNHHPVMSKGSPG